MRRVVSPILVLLGLVAVGLAVGAGAAHAAPANAVCTITDERLVEISGLVATASGYIVVNDGSDVESRRKIFFLDQDCAVTDVVSFPTSPRDPEDLALSPDGQTLYVADTGDNAKRRETVVLWTVPVDGGRPVRNRLTYPDGPHDAEALLVDRDGTPILVTREAGTAALYAPSGPLDPESASGLPMRRIGELTLPQTTTSNPLGLAGRMVITGGATAPDGGRVVLRTYADAFEWQVGSGDVASAITGTEPRHTPLPDEPWGEAIAYTADGAAFITVSETAQSAEGTEPVIQRYEPADAAVPPTAPAQESTPRDGSPLATLSLQDITYLVAGVGVLGALLVVAGIVGIVLARRRAATAGDAPDGRADADHPPGDRPAAGAAGPVGSFPGEGRPPGDRDREHGAASPAGPAAAGLTGPDWLTRDEVKAAGPQGRAAPPGFELPSAGGQVYGADEPPPAPRKAAGSVYGRGPAREAQHDGPASAADHPRAGGRPGPASGGVVNPANGYPGAAVIPGQPRPAGGAVYGSGGSPRGGQPASRPGGGAVYGSAAAGHGPGPGGSVYGQAAGANPPRDRGRPRDDGGPPTPDEFGWEPGLEWRGHPQGQADR